MNHLPREIRDGRDSITAGGVGQALPRAAWSHQCIVTDKLGMRRNPDKHMVFVERVQRTILILRDHRVILDSDLAALYGVETKRLNEQLRRNAARFPEDFAFQLTLEELDNLKSQIATSSGQWGGRRKRPYAFTEHGALMAASVLNSPKAVEMSILVVRALVRLRWILAGNRPWAAKLDELEPRGAGHDKNSAALFQAVRSLMAVPKCLDETGLPRPSATAATAADAQAQTSRPCGKNLACLGAQRPQDRYATMKWPGSRRFLHIPRPRCTRLMSARPRHVKSLVVLPERLRPMRNWLGRTSRPGFTPHRSIWAVFSPSCRRE